MSLKERLVNGDRFHAHTFRLRFEAENAIDHEKRKTMWQDLHHLVRIETAVAARDCSWHGQGASTRLLARD